MKRFVGFLSLLVLLLNSVLMPLTYAQEYQDEILDTQVNNTIEDSSNVENVSETEDEQNEEAEDASEFPVIEENPQEPEMNPVEPVTIPNNDEGSGGAVEDSTIIPEDYTVGSGGNDGSENVYDSEVLTGGGQEIDTQTGAQDLNQIDFSGGNNKSPSSGGSSSDNSENESGASGIISSVASALQDFLSTIRFFFVSDDKDYITESKINGLKAITLEDPDNGEKIIIMDRNLGAEDNDVQSEDSYGYYYQWGNNNGFEEVNASNVTSMLAVYSGKYEGIGYTRDNKFRVGSNDIWEIDEEGKSNYDELWYLGENEEIQGPCPEGYHIPSLNEWNKLVSIWTKIHTQDEKDGVKVTRVTSSDTIESSLERCGTGDFENQENCLVKEELPELANLFMDELKLPRAGRYNNGEKENSLGVYWTRTPGDLSYQSEVFSIEKFFGVEVNENDYKNRSNANSLRCFRNIKNSPSLFGSLSFSDDTLSLNDVDGYTITFDSNGGSPVDPAIGVQPTEDLETYRPKTDPYRVGYMFLGWFDDLNNATRYKFQGKNISTDLVLYAKWAPFNDIVYTGTVNGVTYSITLMDRNMGATATGAMNNATVDSYGFYYMWGNNYGFYYDKGTSINDKYTDASLRPNVSLNGPGNWAYEERFYYGSNAQDNWASSNNNNLWGGDGDNDSNDYDNGNKSYTRQGPCPKGYHVPSIGERSKLLRLFMNNEYPNHSVTTALNNGTWKNKVGKGKGNDLTITEDIRNKIGDTFYLPYAGRVQKTYAWNRQVGDTGDGPRAPYWSSTTKEANKGLGTELKHKDKMFSLGARSDERVQGKAVRCFKNQDEYTIKWKNLEDSSLSASGYILETDYFVDGDEHPHYDGLTPVRGDTPFIGWYIEGGNKRQVYTQEDLDEFTITEDITFVAKFKTYDIDVEIIPSTGGVVSGVDDYYEGSGISLTAEANEGYQFTGWYDESDNLISTDNPYEFTADASDGTGLKALFELKQYIVTVVSNDSSKGTINVTQRPYTHGKRIEFSPNYNSGEYKFVKWKLNGEDVKTGGNQYRTGNLVIEYLTSDLTVTGYFSIYDSCNLPWGGSIAHGESTGAYEKATVPYGQSCVQEIRVCNDGNLSGSYEYKNCEIETPTSCDLPWGGTLANGESVTGYASASETCPDQCVGQRATCISGEWDIPNFESNYLNSSCTTNGVDPVSDGYTLNSCPEHGYCNYKTGYTVNNYACEAGDVKYKLTSCELGYHTEDWLTCTGNTKFVPCSHNDQIPEHSTEKVVDVPVNWNGVSWDDPVKCSWECDTHYHENGNQCDIDTFDITWKYSTETGEQTAVESYAYGSIPSRLGNNYQTDATGYTFVSWTPEFVQVTGPATYTAIYNEEPRSYDITWIFQTENGEHIVVEPYSYGEMPSRLGNNYQTDATGYTFAGWTPTVLPVTGDITYTSTYNETPRSYDITWNYVTETGAQSVIESYLYGETPSRTGYDYQTNVTGYTFNRWTPTIIPVAGNATYTAIYDEETRSYNVAWNYKTETGSHRVVELYKYGETPNRVGDNYQTAATGYTFVGWTPTIIPVVGDAEYTATYGEEPRSYNVTWKYNTLDGEQTVVEPYLYGETPNRVGNNYQTAATGYIFISWTPTVLPVTGDVTYTATYTETPRSYDITWKYQTETGVQSVVESYAYGATPSRVGSDYETAATGYTFLTWTPVPAVVTGNATYTATYNETTKEYSITWVDGDGHELKTEQVAYGLTPSYSGSIPTKSETDQYTYSFNNTWSPAIAPVTQNATYIAQFDSTVRTYRITFVDGDGNIIQSGYVAYDAMPVYEGETPTKTSTPKYSYTFSGSWSPSISKVTGEATYTAQFTETINKYEIIWLDGDGEELKREQVEYDETPEYSGAVPTKTRTDKFSYTFNDAWSPAISKVTGPATYTAQFDSTINKYRITFVDGDGRIIQSGDVEYDKIPVYTGSTPTKTATAKYTYSFSGSWSPAISKVAGDATYVAEFTGTINKYEITWIDGDGNTLKTEQVAYDEIPEYTGAIPTKARTPQYTYTFNHTWSPAVEAVTGDISYTAQFDEEINKYTITFHSNGGTLVAEQVKDYGTTVDEPADPIRDGYGFSGWYSDSGLTQKYSFESTIGGDLDLYAKWTPIVYSIAYELNGGNLTGGVVNPDTYTIESDTITLYNPERVGYTFLGWTGSNGTTNPETTVSIASGSTGNKTYYANWQANIVDVTIKHYLQDLNPVINEVLATYSLSGETYSGELADSTITLGNYALNIEGYTYQHGKVNDIETITTTVLPNGSRVIDLYYTRNTYNYVLTTALGSSTTGSSPTGMYYYGAEVLLSGDTGNDCFMWSGWNIEGTILENNMKKTSFIMPANDVTVASSVTEKSYNIVFVGNGSTSGEMATLTGVMCREEIDLPLNTFKRIGYTFSGWSTTIDGEKKYEDGESVYTLTTGNNVTVDLYALWDINHYQVQWQNYDGYILDEQTLAYNEMPEYKGGVTPTREADAQFTYSFTGWTPEYTRVEGDQVYTAVYSTTVNKYVVTWDVAGSGTTEEYEYGVTPSYKGVPHKDPTKQYTYTFAGWSPTISTVTTGVTYTAIFTPVLRKYTVTWLNSNGDELEVDDEVPYGTTPHYDGATPTKPSDAEHTYIFAGWAPEVGSIEGDTTYHATFSTDTNEYTITWTNEDGTVLETDENVPYGTTPTYNGATPTKQSDAQYDYTFAGWAPTVHAVTKNQIYQATYTETLRKYTITWKNSNGDTLEVDTNVEYGTTPSYDGSTPTSGGDTQYSYVFDTWSPAVDTVHGDATYTAKYKQNINTYKVTWKNRDGTVLEVVNGVEYGATPTHGDINPIRTGNEQYSYSFAGWTPAISAVHGDVEYTAQFTENLNIYNVNFVNDDLSTLKESLPYAYGTTRLEIVKPDDPTKQDDEQYTYEFSGWTPVITIVTGHVTFMATYKTTLRKYTVIWKNYDGTVLETGVNVPYGTMPSYNGATPTKPSTSQYAYRFVGWSPEVSEVHGDITYTAQFEPDLNKYTVIWKNRDGTVLETDEDLPYGVRPIYDGDEPVKTGDVQYTYVFTGWNPDVDIVTTDITYVAKFDSVVNNYSVTWKNRDNTELEVDDEVPYGTTPHYDGETPVRTGNAQFSYVFKGWSPAVDTVHGDMVYKAQYDEVINKYTVTFENYDGTVLQSDELDYGSTPEYTGETPKKTGDAEFSFIFRGWDSAIMEVHEDATYIAQFDSEINKYTIKFIDGDGNILQSGELAYGTMPVYTGSTPTKTADAQYTYTFNYTWSPAISEVTGEATYEAQFSTTVNEYTITWVDGNGNTLKTEQVAYGETPEYSGETPTKDSTSQYTYTFNNTWSPEIVAVAGDATYTAQFNSSVNEYTITWVDGNGNTLKTEQVAYGETPEYSGETPIKDSTPQYTYTFNNTWSPAVVSVIEDATYIAQFSSTVNKYTITWKDGDGNTLKTDEVAYNGTPIYDGTTPTKTATAEYTYTFNNTWSPVVVSVTEDATYTAQFNSVKNKYTITWKDGNDVLLYLEQLEYGEIPEYTGSTPTKAATAQYTYTFNNTWSPAIVSVVGDATYTAQFSSTVNKYTITWKDGDNNTIKTEQVAYGTTPVYQGVTPTKTATAQYTYTFNNTWSPAIVSVTEAATYTAQFTENVIKYVIRFTDYDDSLIIEKQVDYGTTSGNYKPADPVREGYTFIGWIPELETVTGSNTYKATYTINQYTVTPEAGNGVERVEGGGTYDYGTEIVLTGYAKEGYHFEGGVTIKEFIVIVGPNSVIARINAIGNSYKVRFQPGGGEGTMDDQEFTYGLTGVLKANSFRRNGYTFTGWNDEDGNVYADKGKIYNLATGGILLFTALWKTGEVPPEPPVPSTGETAAGGGRIIPAVDEDEHESADLETGATVQTGDDILGDDTQGETGYTTRTEEEMDAYKYAYKYHITTLAPREAARPDEYVIRGHMAKMIVNYAINVLGWKLPEKLPKQCKWNDGVDAWESQEIKDYAEKACALGLMGIDMNYFQPNKYVTRAQFGTIFGRLLRGKLPSTPYYAAHLAGLKERGIMTQIDHPEDMIEIRKWAWLMFMRSEKYFNIKK